MAEIEIESVDQTNFSLLTPSEQNIAKYIFDGMTNNEISDRTQRSLRTVENHRQRVMKKMGVTNAALLVRALVRAGFEA